MRPYAFIIVTMMIGIPGAARAQPEQSTDTSILTLSEQELDSTRGGQETININALNKTTLTASNSGNTVNGESVVSGAISVGSDAFSGFDGVGNFVMNTGNNNNLQGNISITVIVTP